MNIFNKNIIILIISIFFYTLGFSQKSYYPKIIVLLPQNVEFEKETKGNIDFYEKNIIAYQRDYMLSNKDSLLNLINTDNSLTQKEKDRYINTLDFAELLNFENSITQDYSNTIQELINGGLPNCIVLTGKEKSTNNLISLSKLQKQYGADLIINILDLQILNYQKDLLIKPKFSIYKKATNQIISIEPLVKYDTYNNKYLTVGNKTLNLYSDDIDFLTSIINTIKKEADLKQQGRKELFYKKIDLGKNNYEIQKILSEKKVLDNGILYSALVSDDKTNFISFIKENEGNNMVSLAIIKGKQISNKEWELQFKEKMFLLEEEVNNGKLKEMLFEKYETKYFLNNSTNININFWK